MKKGYILYDDYNRLPLAEQMVERFKKWGYKIILLKNNKSDKWEIYYKIGGINNE